MESNLRDVGPNFDQGAALISLDGCVGWIEAHRHSDGGAPARHISSLLHEERWSRTNPTSAGSPGEKSVGKINASRL